MDLVHGLEIMIINGLGKSEFQMKNAYYLIWSDAILSFTRYHPKKRNWKTPIFLLNTWIHALNLWIIFMWLKFFDLVNFTLFSIDLFPGMMLDKVIVFIVIFALPFGILNYFLIFSKNRYKRIIERYPNPPSRCAFIYSSVVAIGALITAILYGILN